MRGRLIIILIVGIWSYQLGYYLLIGFDIGVHIFPFALMFLPLLIILKKQQNESQKTPLFSPLTAILLSIGLVFIYVIGEYYSVMMFLQWNAIAIIAVCLLIYVANYGEHKAI